MVFLKLFDLRALYTVTMIEDPEMYVISIVSMLYLLFQEIKIEEIKTIAHITCKQDNIFLFKTYFLKISENIFFCMFAYFFNN